jgi:hypothetical protein
MTSSAHSDQQAAVALRQAQQLRVIATMIRRLAGPLTYHPTTGERPAPPPELLHALEEIRGAAGAIRDSMDEPDREAAGPAANTPTADGRAELLRAGRAAVAQSVSVVLAALDVLRGLLKSADNASLDAPYGLGAPMRVHPGAMCTIVAERAEHLAHELETVAIVAANARRGSGRRLPTEPS